MHEIDYDKPSHKDGKMKLVVFSFLTDQSINRS